MLLTVVALAVPACGTLDRDAVQTEIKSVASSAAEGALVAHEMERGRMFRSFAEIRTAELHKLAMNASDSLQETPAEDALRPSAQKGATLGDQVSGELERLHRQPTNKAVAHAGRVRLERLAAEARDLADKL
jgi:hypothetical protein